MGSGKSSVGRLLAEKLGIPFADLDREIEHRLSHTVAEIFEARGEPYFREQETAMLKSFNQDPLVMATGGGCFIYNRDWLLQNGTVIFLNVPFDDIIRRIGGDPNRPLWVNAKKLYLERLEEYQKAHHIVDGTGREEDVVDRIITLLLPELQKTPES
jgi:shikimate kinase